MGTHLALSRRARTRTITILTLVSALTLAACGDDADTSTAPASDDSAPDAATEEPTDDAVAAPTGNLVDGCAEDGMQDVDLFPDRTEFTEAVGVEVTYEDTYKVVTVAVPFAEEGAPPFTAVLVQCGTEAPELTGELDGAIVVEVPAQEVVTLTTVNLPHFAGLDALGNLAGVGTAAFVTTPEVVAEIADRGLEDFALPSGETDREKLIAASPDLMIVDAFGATLLDDVRGYADADVPTVINADFNEVTPLGRAEWLKFTALFLNREAEANALYDEIAADYAETAALTADVEDRPLVLLDQPFEGVWYAPAGGSFVGRMVADAGGDYVFADEEQAGSLSLDIETVLAEGADADIWIGAGSVNGTLEDLAASDERFRQFAAFTSGDVWAVDGGTTETGGNPLFEEAVMRPDLVLADLTAIIHPDVLPDHEFSYYGPVPQAG